MDALVRMVVADDAEGLKRVLGAKKDRKRVLKSELGGVKGACPETTLLGLAAERGRLQAMRTLVGLGAVVNVTKGSSSMNAMMMAARAGRAESVDALCEFCGDVHVRFADEHRRITTPLIEAALCGRGIDCVVALLGHEGGLAHFPEIASSALLAACGRDGNFEVAQALLCSGASCSTRGDASTCLHVAFGRGDESLSRLLLMVGADPNAPDDRGLTPLHLAGGDVVSVRLAEVLLESGGDLGSCDSHKTCVELRDSLVGQVDKSRLLTFYLAGTLYGSEALRLACQRGDFDEVQLLLQGGADPLFHEQGEPLPLVAAMCDPELSSEVSGILMKAMAGRIPAGVRANVLTDCLLGGCSDVGSLRRLLETVACIDVNATSRTQETALHLTSRRGYLAVTELLLRCGADVNAKDQFSNTPAAVAKDPETLSLLLSHGGTCRSALRLSEDGAGSRILCDYGLRPTPLDATDTDVCLLVPSYGSDTASPPQPLQSEPPQLARKGSRILKLMKKVFH